MKKLREKKIVWAQNLCPILPIFYFQFSPHDVSKIISLPLTLIFIKSWIFYFPTFHLWFHFARLSNHWCEKSVLKLVFHGKWSLPQYVLYLLWFYVRWVQNPNCDIFIGVRMCVSLIYLFSYVHLTTHIHTPHRHHSKQLWFLLQFLRIMMSNMGEIFATNLWLYTIF